MKTLPILGTSFEVSFLEDDTIEVVRQHIALVMNNHPDRLFIEILTTLPAGYYAKNAQNWMGLFERLTRDGRSIPNTILEYYCNHIRTPTNERYTSLSKTEWEENDLPELKGENETINEWICLGVTPEKSTILVLPPEEKYMIDSTRIPIPQNSSIFSTIHNFETIQLRVTEISKNMPQSTIRTYAPFLSETTPPNILSVKTELIKTRNHINDLLSLNYIKPKTVHYLKAQWELKFVSTIFPMPRSRFEQIFYGMTLSPDKTPYIGFFTSKQDNILHKFYVENPTKKVPTLNTDMLKSWLSTTKPQRKLPTLLLYRGSSRTSYDRIAITPKDIYFTCIRPKENTETIEDLQKNLNEWLLSFDAFVPFVAENDLNLDRWVLKKSSLIIQFPNDVDEFDSRRLHCLKNVFLFDKHKFSFLRSDRPTSSLNSQELDAFRFLYQTDDPPSPELLVKNMNISIQDATRIFNKLKSVDVDNFDPDAELAGYPTIQIYGKKSFQIIDAVHPERTIEYASILRYILSSNGTDIDSVCPRRMEVVEPTSAKNEEEDELESIGFGSDDDEDEPVPVQKPDNPSKSFDIPNTENTPVYNYSSQRAKKLNPEIFKANYPSVCDKAHQVALVEKSKKHPTYNYDNIPDNQKIDLGNVVAGCPPYWCITDEIPLEESDLVDGKCPVCGGKQTKKDQLKATAEFSVMKRPDPSRRFAKFKQPENMPCCYKSPARTQTVIEKTSAEGAFYVLNTPAIPEFRLAFIPETLSKLISLKTDYKKTVKQSRFVAGETDYFRVGLGTPRKTLPVILGLSKEVPRPKDAPDILKQCSFFRTWSYPLEGKDFQETLVTGIDSAYVNGTLPAINEIEYVTAFLKCRVIRINIETNEVSCGFWTEMLHVASSTIVLLGTDILAQVTRRSQKVGSTFKYEANINNIGKEPKSILTNLNDEACNFGHPTYMDGLKELLGKKHEYILDPFDRVQALFVVGEVVLPITPTAMNIPAGMNIRNGYHEIKETELPTRKELYDFFTKTKHASYFKIDTDIYDTHQQRTGFLLKSGFQTPYRPEPTEEEESATDVLRYDEETLVTGETNKEHADFTTNITYTSEVFSFLLFSLAKDLQDEEYEDLRRSIIKKSSDLEIDLRLWLENEAYWSHVGSPSKFISKVRKPCGQMAKGECQNSNLCGWSKDSCKIELKPIIKKDKILKQLVDTLLKNEKQRSIVLENRVSPFFSTALYIEMPNEWITIKL
jgi:hypothetical protein